MLKDCRNPPSKQNRKRNFKAAVATKEEEEEPPRKKTRVASKAHETLRESYL